MMVKEKKVFKHGMTDKVPYLVSVLLMLFGFIFAHILDGKIAGLLGIDENTAVYDNINTAGCILLSICLMLLFTRWFYPEFEGFFKKDGLKEGFLYATPFFVFWAVWYFIELMIGKVIYNGDAIGGIIAGFNPGFAEEVAFRGLAVTVLLRSINKEHRIFVAPVFVGVLFGGIHFLNLTAGEPPLLVALTACFATVVGVSLGVIYTLSGNIWVVIVAHSLYDAVSFIFPHPQEGPDWSIMVDLVAMIVLTIFYIVVLVRKKDETLALWRRKWNYKEVQSPEPIPGAEDESL